MSILHDPIILLIAVTAAVAAGAVAFRAIAAKEAAEAQLDAERRAGRSVARIKALTRVGEFRWHQDGSITFDDVSLQLMGLPAGQHTVPYDVWAARTADQMELNRAQEGVSPSLSGSTQYADVIRYRNGRSILHVGTPNANGYKMAGFSVDVSDILPEIVGEARMQFAAAHEAEHARVNEQLMRLRRLLDSVTTNTVEEIISRGGEHG